MASRKLAFQWQKTTNKACPNSWHRQDGNIDYGEMIAIEKDEVFDFYHEKKMCKKDDPQLQSFTSAQQEKPWLNFCSDVTLTLTFRSPSLKRLTLILYMKHVDRR